ncbi:FAD synthase [groundwater metagenome]|uniref:FAD synthase n=1 Tax=groundwater metagenome TaxID=717931 RepID=A0A098E7G3_9ZZZZ
MKTVVATGVFEILHPGHIKFLTEAKKLGGKLMVIVARDKFISKKKNIIISEEQRLEVIKSLMVVDEAILGDENDIFEPIEKIKPDIIALGKNQLVDEKMLAEELKKRNLNAKVIRIENFYDANLNSTTKIKEKILRTYISNKKSDK